jgi:TonB-linked SusC/RagA family outer membrane protein
VDGVEMNIDNIDPESIENISILKDASASAIYGSRAPFGVVLITTRKGKKNQPTRISYNNNISFAKPLNIPHFVDSKTWVEAYNWARNRTDGGKIYTDEVVARVEDYLAGRRKEEYLVGDPTFTSWFIGRRIGNANYDYPAMFYGRNGLTQKHNVNVEGGGDKTQCYLSGSFMDQRGLHKWGDDYYQRYNLVANISTQITDWIKVGVNTKFARSIVDSPLGNIQGGGEMTIHDFYKFGPCMPMYNVDGTVNNALVKLLQSSGRDHLINNDLMLTLSAEIEPIKGWKTSLSYNFDLNTGTENKNEIPVMMDLPNGTLLNVGFGVSGSSEAMHTNNYYMFNVMTSYEKLLGKHYLKGLIGYEQELSENRGLLSSRKNLFTEQVVSLNTGYGDLQASDAINHWATQGVFGRVNYNFDEKYLFEFSARYNGSSKFPKDSRWGFFPSVSAGYNISKEDFWEPIEKYINQLKLRVSYGSLGNCNTGNYRFLPTLPIETNYRWIMDGGNRPLHAYMPGIVSDKLTWETITTLNFGLEAGFLKNRLSVSAD